MSDLEYYYDYTDQLDDIDIINDDDDYPAILIYHQLQDYIKENALPFLNTTTSLSNFLTFLKP